MKFQSREMLPIVAEAVIVRQGRRQGVVWWSNGHVCHALSEANIVSIMFSI